MALWPVSAAGRKDCENVRDQLEIIYAPGFTAGSVTRAGSRAQQLFICHAISILICPSNTHASPILILQLYYPNSTMLTNSVPLPVLLLRHPATLPQMASNHRQPLHPRHIHILSVILAAPVVRLRLQHVVREDGERWSTLAPGGGGADGVNLASERARSRPVERLRRGDRGRS